MFNNKINGEVMKEKLDTVKAKSKAAWTWVKDNPDTAFWIAGVVSFGLLTIDGMKTAAVQRKVLKSEAESKKAYARYYNNRA